jgi:predicted small secreted protein
LQRPATPAAEKTGIGRPTWSAPRLAFALAASVVLSCVPNVSEGQGRDTSTAAARIRAAADSAAPPCCTVVRLDSASAIVTARETATGYTFRFEMKNRRLRESLGIGDPVWADFANKRVKLNVTDEHQCCTIVTPEIP